MHKVIQKLRSIAIHPVTQVISALAIIFILIPFIAILLSTWPSAKINCIEMGGAWDENTQQCLSSKDKPE